MISITNQPVLSTGEVAQVFRVDPATVARWARDGRLPYFHTLGGHRRFRAEDVQRLLNGQSETQ